MNRRSLGKQKNISNSPSLVFRTHSTNVPRLFPQHSGPAHTHTHLEGSGGRGDRETERERETLP